MGIAIDIKLLFVSGELFFIDPTTVQNGQSDTSGVIYAIGINSFLQVGTRKEIGWK